MLESFIKYTAEEPWNIDRVTDFLDAHSARVRKKVERNQSFSQQEMDEIQEFGKYFIEQYADEEGLLDQEIADCYDEIHLYYESLVRILITRKRWQKQNF